MSDTALVRYTPDQIRDMAQAVVQSGMFPGIKNVNQAMTLFMLADANGMHPMKAALMYDVLPSGKPSMKGEAMLAEFQARGGTVKWLRRDAEECRGIFTSPGCPEGFEASFTIEDAKIAQLIGKDNYRKYAPDMLQWRCVTRGVKATLPAAGLGLYPTEVARDFEENQPPEVREKADAEIMASTGQDIEEKPLSAVLGVSKVNVAGAMVKMAGFKCDLCGSQIAQFPSEAKDTPGRLYWMCENAHAEQLERRKKGETIAKAKAAIKGHFGCASRQWAEVWPRPNGGDLPASDDSGSESTNSLRADRPGLPVVGAASTAPPSSAPSLDAEVERLKAKQAAVPFRQPEVHEQVKERAEKIADEVHQMGGPVEEQLEEIKRRVAAQGA